MEIIEAERGQTLAESLGIRPPSSDSQLGTVSYQSHPAEVLPAKRPLASSLIYQALVDLANANKTATRQTIMEATGLNYSIVDDHIKRRIVDGSVRRVVNGVFELVPNAPEDRSISLTQLPGGACKLEVGDVCLDLTLRETRMVGIATAGAVMQFGR